MSDDLGFLTHAAIEQFQSGNLEMARNFLTAALQQRPDQPDLRRFMGLLLCRMGQPAEGVGHLRAAIALGGETAELSQHLGWAHRDLGELAEAAACFRRALELEPPTAERLCILADCLADLDQPEAAVATYGQALALEPNHPEALSNLALTLYNMGRLDEAAGWFAKALAVNPGNQSAAYSLGCLLQKRGETEEAARLYQHSLALQPDHAESLTNLGSLRQAQGRYAEAEALFRRALAATPDHLEALCNLGGCLLEQERLAEAEPYFRRCTEIDPTTAKGHSNLGVALYRQGRFEDAAASLRRAVAVEPDFIDGHFNLALVLLQKGELAEGWAEYEWRWRKTSFEGGARRHAEHPLWDGSAAAGRTILLWSEQGAGDAIQLVRHVLDLRRAGWRVLLEVPASLTRLFRQWQGVEVFAIGAPLPAFDMQCPFFSLPHLGGLRPDPAPYLTPEDSLRQPWRQRLEGLGDRPKIGLVWRGNPGHRRDRYRSIPAALFGELLPAGAADYVILQTDARPEELAALASLSPLNWGTELTDYADSAALISCLDRVVSVDSSVCHLAGALGIPVLTLAEWLPDWRWGFGPETTDWYGSMTLLRQPEPGQWRAVLERVAGMLG